MKRARHILRRTALFCGLWLAALQSAAAQTADAALLVADEVLITKDNRLVAKGNVEAYYDGTRVFTDEIIYDQERDELIIPGPVRLSQDGGDIILAESADLDSKLEDGILKGARYVLNEELQILSAQTDRVEGRYTVLRKVIATSCQICGNGPPIWQIRAQRAIHDREEKQIYFKRAQFRMLGVPVLYLPRLRIPDPSLSRATGFLVPRFVSNSELGFGVKVPYFIKISDHADLTVTPFVTTQSQTLELRYRKQFYRGYVELNGAISQDTITSDTIPDGTLRYYLTGYGAFDLGSSVVLSLDVETTSDLGYNTLYGYTGRDRFGSGATLSRIKRNVFFSASLYNFETLRNNEANDLAPTLLGDLAYERRYQLPRLGGETRARLEMHGHKRVSLADGWGRDMGRITFDLDWQRTWTGPSGLRFGLSSGVGLDSHVVRQDSTAMGRTQTAVPKAAMRLSWPLHAKGRDGAKYLLEPIAQIGWVGGDPSALPNDESVSTEFDEGNLLALSRFSTKERRETGTIGVLGFRWERMHEDGLSAGLTLGQVFRDTADPTFTQSSGLTGLTSDTLVALHMETGWGGALMARGLFDADLEPTKAEARFTYARNKWAVTGSYTQLKADLDELRTDSLAEWAVDATFKANRHWTFNSGFQYDIKNDVLAKTTGKITYENECISVGLGATQNFTNTSDLIPATTYELAVTLRGFSTGGSGKAARRKCRSY